MWLIFLPGGGDVPSPCLQFVVPVLDVPVPSPLIFGPFPFPFNPRETENSYFETQTQQRENSAKPVIINSFFPVYDLFWNLITRVGPPDNPVCPIQLNSRFYIFSSYMFPNSLMHVHGAVGGQCGKFWRERVERDIGRTLILHQITPPPFALSLQLRLWCPIIFPFPAWICPTNPVVRLLLTSDWTGTIPDLLSPLPASLRVVLTPHLLGHVISLIAIPEPIRVWCHSRKELFVILVLVILIQPRHHGERLLDPYLIVGVNVPPPPFFSPPLLPDNHPLAPLLLLSADLGPELSLFLSSYKPPPSSRPHSIHILLQLPTHKFIPKELPLPFS